MRGKAWVLGAALSLSSALLVGGCESMGMDWSSDVSFTIDRERTVAGQTIEVHFDRLADEDGRRYWIAVVPAETPRIDPVGRIVIPQGVRTMRLTPRIPGACEVRVFTESNADSNMVVGRKKIRVLE